MILPFILRMNTRKVKYNLSSFQKGKILRYKPVIKQKTLMKSIQDDFNISVDMAYVHGLADVSIIKISVAN